MTQERSILIGDGATRLEARYAQLGRDLAVIAPPHPLMGGDMDNPVVEALTRGFQLSGWSTLRFNYRGIGDSGGTPSGAMADAVKDYGRVVAWARTHNADWLTFAGYSFGAMAAIETHLSGIDCICVAAVAPPTSALTNEMMEQLNCYYALIYGKHDSFIEPYRVTELSTHVRDGQVSILDTDHFFANQDVALESYAQQVGSALADAHNSPNPYLDDED